LGAAALGALLLIGSMLITLRLKIGVRCGLGTDEVRTLSGG
jgi:hypothetical protein